MTMIDEHGRLFGRVNLLDAVIVLLAVGLIPLGYGAYVLFQAPPPRVTAVEPATLQAGPNMRVTIRGENLRPYMRVSFGNQQGLTFLFGSPTMAEVDIGSIAPGVYDVVLYDYEQERDRLPGALTVTPPPVSTTYVDVAGTIRNVFPETAKAITPGLVMSGWGTVLEVGEPSPARTVADVGTGTIEIPADGLVDLPVLARLGCTPGTVNGRAICSGGGVPMGPGVVLDVATPGGRVPLQIDQVRSTLPLTDVEAHVRFVGDAAALGLLKAGDTDVGVSVNAFAAGARVVSAGPVQRMPAPVTVLAGSRVLAGPTLAAREVTLRVPAQPGRAAWRYAAADLRVGGTLDFRTRTYELQGTVLAVTPDAAPPQVPGQ